MALIKYGGGIVQMSGSIAGNTHARNRFGNYMRARTKPVNPNTDAQASVRAVIAFLTEHWKDALSDAQRTAWNTYAAAIAWNNKLGEVVHLTGFNHFMRANSFLSRLDKTVVLAGPTVLSLPVQDPLFSCTGVVGGNAITVTFDDTLDWDNETGGYLVYYQGQPQPHTRNFFNGPWKLLSYTAGVDGVPVASPVVETGVYTLIEGQRVWVKARIIRADGRMSGEFQSDFIVGP